MRPPQTVGDWIWFLVLTTVVFAMGVLLLCFPAEPIPEHRSGYIEHSGLLEVVVAKHSGRRSSLVRFRIINDPVLYESAAPGINEAAASWRNRQTALTFYSAAKPRQAASKSQPVVVYGVAANGVAIRSLEADIKYINAGASSWGAALAVSIGLVGYLVAGLFWWRRRAA